ncbi:MAG TPA: nodulation protein NfeD [Candidatus Limnocylindrales bacterium]|nr:nodulation protein NfeD [Candidatus Limnocylindrales bacterium]
MHAPPARAIRVTNTRALPILLVLLGLASLLASAVRAQERRVVVLPTTGIVDQVMAGYLRDGVQRAANEGAAAVVIQIDTPGGSVDSTRQIVTTLLEAPLPTIVWVAPAGGRAASAGTFVTLAAHVALMAPGTNIGAATPVGGQGEDIEGTLGTKVLNDTIALITSIAEERGRNVEWAVETVKEARSSPAREAVELGAVDGLADSLGAVLEAADGRAVIVRGERVTIETVGAAVEELPMNPLQAFLHLLADPNIAFILFTIGTYGLIYEVISPNFVTGILGAMAIILAFIGFGSLPLNVGGLLLIALAIVLFVLELTVTSHGLLTIAGLVCFVLGSAALYTEPGPTTPEVPISTTLPIIVIMAIATVAFMTLVVAAALRTRRMAPLALGLGGGSGGVLAAGTPAEVRRPLDPTGSVYAAGEEWTARSTDERRIGRGTPVRVVRQEGLTLIVEPLDVTGPGVRSPETTPVGSGP